MSDSQTYVWRHCCTVALRSSRDAATAGHGEAGDLCIIVNKLEKKHRDDTHQPEPHGLGRESRHNVPTAQCQR